MAAAPLWLPACSTRWRIFPAARSLDCRPAGRPSKAGQVLVRTDDGDFRARPRPGTGQCRRRDPRSREHGDCPDIGGIMIRSIRPVGYVAGWGFAHGMDATIGWNRD